MRHAPLKPIALLIVLSLPPATSFAAWPHYPATSGLPLSASGTSCGMGAAVPDGAGGTIVAWYQYGGVSGWDIYAQRVSAEGVPLWAANGVPVCSAAGDQQLPVLCTDNLGGCFVAWSDYRNSATADLYAQHLNSAGIPTWTANGAPVCTAANDQGNERTAPDPYGGVVLCWMDYRAGNWDVYGEHLSSIGTPLWSAGGGLAIATGPGQSANPSIGFAGGYGQVAYVAWDDDRGGLGQDIYVQRIGASGALSFPANGLVLCNAGGVQYGAAVAVDQSAGTAIVTWSDARGATGNDIYAQRIGATTPYWPPNGVPLCVAAGPQINVTAASDGHGGAVVAWEDRRGLSADIYVQHVDGFGNANWTLNGVAASAAPGDQIWPRIVGDGSGGALVGWTDTRSTIYDLYAQHVSAAGTALWAPDGVAVCTAASDKSSFDVAAGAAGDLFVAWTDARAYNGSQVYVQRIDEFGVLGGEPLMHGVKDVPYDNGGKVKVSWDASPLDLDPAFRNLTDYVVLRSAPPAAVQQAIRANRVIDLAAPHPGAPASPDGAILATTFGAQVYYWEQLATVTPLHTAGYSYIAPTTGDSIGAGNPRTLFAVMARNVPLGRYWTSRPDSGYSVDNIPPVTPAPFTAQYAAGSTSLHWAPNPDPDVAYYQVFRGSSVGFVPGAGNLVASPPDTGYTDVAGGPYVYKLVAVDLHGNVSPPAVVIPAGALGVPLAAPPSLALAAPSPNPLRAGAGSTLRFSLPAAGRVNLSLYDSAGRLARTLASGVREAGDVSVVFDGRDPAGSPLAPGLYFLRLVTPAGSRTARLAVTK